MKTFTVTYEHTVKVEATVFASCEDEALAKFNNGDFEEELDIDSLDVDILSVKEEPDA